MIDKSLNDRDTYTGVFSVLKLSKTGFFKDERILIINEDGAEYYKIPENTKGKNKNIDNFLLLFKHFKERIQLFSAQESNKNPQSPQETSFEELVRSYNLIKDDLKSNDPKYNCFKDGIPFEELDHTIATNDQKINKKKFMCCVVIKNKADKDTDKPKSELYERIKQMKNTSSSLNKKQEQTKEWILDFRNNNYYLRFKSLCESINNKKIQIKNEKENHLIQQENLNKQNRLNKKEVKQPTKIEPLENKVEIEQDPDILNQIHYLEITYQYLLKQYFQVINTNNNNNNNLNVSYEEKIPEFQKLQNKLRLELAILHCNQKFKDICSILVKRIVHDLGSKTFSPENSLFLNPMVYTISKNLRNSENAVFLYNIVGINFSVTWHQIALKLKDSGIKSNDGIEETILTGSWNHLLNDFKHRDYLNEILIKLQEELPSKTESPRIPMTCVIDYIGFRVFCEADIYTDDGGVACTKGDPISNNTTLNDEWSFFKKISELVQSDKLKENNIKANNSSAINNQGSSNTKETFLYTNSIVPVNFGSIKETKQPHHKHQNFANNLRFFYKSFKEIDALVFNDIVGKMLYTSEINEYKEHVLKEQQEESNSHNDSENYDDMSFKKQQFDDARINDLLNKKIKNYEYFDYFNNNSFTLSNIFKDSVYKYILDTKSLPEMLNKEKNNEFIHTKKQESIDKKTLLFKPEYLLKFLYESLNENSDKFDKEKIQNNNYIYLLKKHLFLENDNNTVSNQQLNLLYKNFKDFQIYYFLNSLDSLYYKPDDSETLRECFHNCGVNMYYLGFIAEVSSVPHIRELCLIEMIASVCKKLIFDLIAQKIVENAYNSIYNNNNDKEIDFEVRNNNINIGGSGNYEAPSFLQNVPASLFIKYNTTGYLKKIHELANLKMNYFETGKERKSQIRGLYRVYWNKFEHYSDSELRKIFSNNKTDDKTGNTNKIDKTALENEVLLMVKKEIVKFMNVLFNFVPEKFEKHEVEILKVKYKNSSLWRYILYERVKTIYNVNSNNLFKLCSPRFMSLAALFNAIQFHTGITFNLNLVISTRFPNSELINREFTEDMIVDIKPLTKSFNFRNFSVNDNSKISSKLYYKLLYDPQEYKEMLIRYIKEKVYKPSTFLTIFSFHYQNILRKTENINKDLLVDHLIKFDFENKEKAMIINSDYFKSQFSNNATKFNSIGYIFLSIMDQFFSNVKDEDKTNINNSFVKFSKQDEDYKIAVDYIKDFWHSKHPHLCILNLLYARLHIRTKLLLDDRVEGYYKEALYIAKESLGTNSLFYASLCEEVAQFYLATDKYFSSVKLLLQADVFYSQHIDDELFECYIRNLKRISKYYIVLGDYKEALYKGQELINQYLSHLKRNKESINIKIDSFILNLIYIAGDIEKWDIGVNLCRILFFELNNINDKDMVVNNFKDYRKKYRSSYSNLLQNSALATFFNNNNNNTNNLTNMNTNIILNNSKMNNNNNNTNSIMPEKVDLNTLVEVYLRMVMKSLKDSPYRDTFIRCVIKLTENKIERMKLSNMSDTPLNIVVKNLMNDLKETLDLNKYINNILQSISMKYEQSKGYKVDNIQVDSEKTNNNINEKAWEKFVELYRAFSGKSDMFVIFKEY